MAGKSDIQAGKAVVTLGLNNAAFIKGLRKSSDMLKDFGKGMAAVGAAFSGVGAAILAPFAVAVNQLLETGDAFDKMRQRTGLSVEAISELDHAAGQSATTLETVEGAIGKMQKGLIAGNDAFGRLGLSIDELQKLSPEDQFAATAAAINKIKDPTQKAAAAMAVFGKTGTQLLPMIQDLEALRQEARDMGFVMGGDSAGAAVKLGDMLANLTKTVKWAGMAVADALIEPLIAGVTVLQHITSAAAKWIRENRQLVVTIAAVGAGLLVAGAAITALGVAIAGAGVVLGGIATGLTAIGSVLAVLLSPLGLITGALVAGVAAWAFYTESGRIAVNELMSLFSQLWDTFKWALGGVVDALMSGNLAAAGRIAMLGLRIAFLQGVDVLSNHVGGALGDFMGTIGQQLANGDISGVWSTMVDGLWSVWTKFTEGIIAAFTAAADFVIEKWRAATTFIAKQILALAKALPPSIGELILGVDPTNLDLGQLQQNASEGVAHAAQGARNTLGLDQLNADAQARTRAAADNLNTGIAGGAAGTSDAIKAMEAELEREVEAVKKQREELARNSEATKQNTNAVFAQMGKGSKFAATSSSAAAIAMAGGRAGSQRQSQAMIDAAGGIRAMLRELIWIRRQNRGVI